MAQTDKAGPPLILALETATEVSSVAVFSGDQLLGCVENIAHNQHAKLITMMVEQVLGNIGKRAEDLDAVCVSKGPGSYTGLRVGMSAAKGICYALEIPLLSCGSLEALASQVLPLAQTLDARICAMIDARRMEVYHAVFSPDGAVFTDTKALIIDESTFGPLLEQGKMIIVGSGVQKCVGLLSVHANAFPLPGVLSSARAMGTPAYRRLTSGQAEDLITFEPFYLKDFVATESKKKML